MDASMFSAMQTDEPIVTYRKTIVGKVQVNLLDPFSGNPVTQLLTGNQEDAKVDLWDDRQIAYFKRMNKKNIGIGYLVVVDKNVEEVKNYNYSSDDELEEILGFKWIKQAELVSSITDINTLNRLHFLAVKLEKSAKIISLITARISVLQLNVEN